MVPWVQAHTYKGSLFGWPTGMSKICIILFHLLILSGSGEDNLIEWHPSSQTLESFIKCYYTDTPGVSSGAVASAVRLLRCIHFSLSCWSFLGSVIFMSCLDPQGSSELSLLSPAPLHPVVPVAGVIHFIHYPSLMAPPGASEWSARLWEWHPRPSSSPVPMLTFSFIPLISSESVFDYHAALCLLIFLCDVSFALFVQSWT